MASSKGIIFIFLVATLLFSSCGSQDTITVTDVPDLNSIEIQPNSLDHSGTLSGDGIFDIPGQSGAMVKVDFQIGRNTSTLSLPSNIWGKARDIGKEVYQLSQTGVVGPVIFAIALTNSSVHSGGSLKIANADIVLHGVRDSHYKTERYGNSEVYTFGGTAGMMQSRINLSLLDDIQKYAISKLPKQDLQKQLFPLSAKRIFVTKALKNSLGEVIGYASACSATNDSYLLAVLNSYCILTFDGKTAKEYTYELRFDDLLQGSPDLESEYKTYRDGVLKQFKMTTEDANNNTPVIAQTQKPGADMFARLYASSIAFKKYIDAVDQIAITNY